MVAFDPAGSFQGHRLTQASNCAQGGDELELMFHRNRVDIRIFMLTFLATTSSLATDLTAAGGEGIGEGAVARLDMMASGRDAK